MDLARGRRNVIWISIVLSVLGVFVYCFLNERFKKRTMRKLLICPSCEAIISKIEQPQVKKCSKCGVPLVELEGFYEK